MSTKPDILELENLRTELIEKSGNPSSINIKVYYYYNYFEKILAFNNLNINESFLKEFVDDYINSLNKYEVFGTEPEFTSNLIAQLKKLLHLSALIENTTALEDSANKIKNQYSILISSIEGKDFESGYLNKAFFPLIGQEEPSIFFGIIDSITVRIKKTTDEDKFLIVPSEKEIEQKIIEQCKNSWQLAIRIIKKYVKKPYKYHEVIIGFDKKIGIYEGNSLGIALTISFIEEVLKLYNPGYEISIKEKTAFTGGVTDSGKVINIGEGVIQQKISAIFVSNINNFAIPKSDETAAIIELNKLQGEYPERKLKLIPVEEIDDILNRRDLIEIKKRNPVLRTGRFVKKNWISAVAVVLLSVLFSYLYLIDWDKNPTAFYADGNYIYVTNKNGKILWSAKQPMPKLVYTDKEELENMIRLIDIDNDNINEIIYTRGEFTDDHKKRSPSEVMCIKNLSDTLWTYQFRDPAKSDREILSNDYGISILDYIKMNGDDILILWATNTTSFSNAVFPLNLKTGQRINKTHWFSGHITCGILLDINRDGIKDLVMGGIDNGYEQAVLWGVEFSQMDGYRETIPSYIIRGKKKSQLLFYIRIPKLDYENYMGFRNSAITPGSLTFINSDSLIHFYTYNYYDRTQLDRLTLMDYNLKPNLIDFNIYITNQFRVVRDSLVAKGKLKKPYTDTKEYIEQQKDRILYLYNNKWVHKQDLK